MANNESEQYKCNFCKKVFVREQSLINHMCEKKRRWIAKDERHVKLAFYAYQEFYRRNTNSKTKTYEDFINSQYYVGFVKFGKHITTINIIEPNEFILFVLKTGVKLEHWCKDYVYEEFVRYQIERESCDKAVERNILLMEQWHLQVNKNTEANWNDFFREISTTLAVYYIKTGRISPWVLYQSRSGRDLLSRMSDEELGLVGKYIDVKFWNKKFNKYPNDVKFVNDVCKEAGL